MTQERVVGHVVGSDISQGREVWKVRSSEGTKFKVASVYGNIALAPGVNVSFLVGSFKEGEQTVRKALDVRLLSETREELRPEAKPSIYDSLSLVVMRHEGGDEYVWITDHENEQEAQSWARSIGEPVGFRRFDINDFQTEICDFNEARQGFAAISAIACIKGVDRALEQLLTTAYELGKQAQHKED